MMSMLFTVLFTLTTHAQMKCENGYYDFPPKAAHSSEECAPLVMQQAQECRLQAIAHVGPIREEVDEDGETHIIDTIPSNEVAFTEKGMEFHTLFHRVNESFQLELRGHVAPASNAVTLINQENVHLTYVLSCSGGAYLKVIRVPPQETRMVRVP